MMCSVEVSYCGIYECLKFKQSHSHQWWLWWSFLTLNRLLDPIYFVADRHCCLIDFPRSALNGLIQPKTLLYAPYTSAWNFPDWISLKCPHESFENDTSMTYRSQFEGKTLDGKANYNISMTYAEPLVICFYVLFLRLLWTQNFSLYNPAVVSRPLILSWVEPFPQFVKLITAFFPCIRQLEVNDAISIYYLHNFRRKLISIIQWMMSPLSTSTHSISLPFLRDIFIDCASFLSALHTICRFRECQKFLHCVPSIVGRIFMNSHSPMCFCVCGLIFLLWFSYPFSFHLPDMLVGPFDIGHRYKEESNMKGTLRINTNVYFESFHRHRNNSINMRNCDSHCYI